MRTVDMADTLGLAALDVDLDPAPTVDAPEAQGDLLLIPWDAGTAPAKRAADVAAARPVVSPVSVVEGRGGNTHWLVDPDGCGILWNPYPDSGQTVGVLVVPADGRACMDHMEHGRSAVGSGVWVIRRQREQADEIRAVAD
jgi:hypothetical protein